MQNVRRHSFFFVTYGTLCYWRRRSACAPEGRGHLIVKHRNKETDRADHLKTPHEKSSSAGARSQNHNRNDLLSPTSAFVRTSETPRDPADGHLRTGEFTHRKFPNLYISRRRPRGLKIEPQSGQQKFFFAHRTPHAQAAEPTVNKRPGLLNCF